VKILPALGGPDFWLVMFRRETSSSWLDRAVPGHWKHVSAVGYFPDARCWVAVDPTLRGIWVDVRRGEESGNWLDVVAAGGGVLKVGPRRSEARVFRQFWCVPAVAAMVGSRSGALLPDRFWRDLIAEGAEIVADEDGCAEATGRPGSGTPGQGS
jgi:hypothetical protein